MINKFQLIHLFVPLTLLFIALSIFGNHKPFIQPLILLIFTLIYLFLTILHHKLDKSLTLEGLLEYILIAGLIIVLINSLMI